MFVSTVTHGADARVIVRETVVLILGLEVAKGATGPEVKQGNRLD